MTAWNTARYVPEAIESILQQQTSRSWELLFVEDGSTDGTLQVATHYAARFPESVRVLQHRGGANRGISASRNLALLHARGTYLAFLDSDDVWLPHHLETLATLLDTIPSAAMVYAGAERWVDFHQPFDEASARASTWGSNYLPPLVPKGCGGGLLPAGQLLEWFLQDESLVPCICTVMARTNLARALGGFCNEFRGLYDDQVFHAKMSLGHPVYAHDVCVARYRQHAASCCATARTSAGIYQREQNRFEGFLNGYAGLLENDSAAVAG